MSYTQRETPILAELCTLLVGDVYGELAARVYTVLARYGRQTLAAIARASYLNGRQIKYGLVILLQQHLIFHSGNDAGVTYYEIDWQNSYALIRVGKVAKLVEDRFGKKAANVISNLLTLGHTRVADLKEAYFPPDTDTDDGSDDGMANRAGVKRRRVNGAHTNGPEPTLNGVVNGLPVELEDSKPDVETLPNGEVTIKCMSKATKPSGSAHDSVQDDNTEQEPDEIASVDELYDIIQLLIERGWVRTVTDTQYLSPGDVHDMLQEEAIGIELHGAAISGIKDRDKVHRTTQHLKRKMRDDWLVAPRFSRKRKADDSQYNGATKRVKLNGSHNPSTSAAHCAEDHLVIRVNPEKVAVAMRTEQLVQLVEQRLGPVTAHIYRNMLQTLEENTPRCYEEFPEPPLPGGEPAPDIGLDPRSLVTARDVAKKLPRDLDICEGLDPNAVVAVTRKGHVRSSNILSQPIDPNKLSMDQRTELVDKHIRLLAEDPLHFATWHSRAGFSQWHIEFEEIAKQLIQAEVENTISARKGALGVKLIRALRKKGKLDERATCNAMMMSANDIRGIVNDLTVQGFVQTQEIPKVERREAKHSLHLVWYDRQRAREKLLHDTYKGMVRILQRIEFEREKVQPLLSKAERSDVVGNEAKWLSKGELDALQKWKEVQEKLLLQLFREDDLVATLRDFHGPLVSV
ncbi:DNA directed RNA polymeras-like protein III subunit Rpc82 [Ampelomyces quisqualis]|uniref:DNA-directed RNA polymerase III subunit RPC3 n=1 Tax=Ampelomyces quisqualis TaxID=50730 RepID=A0A6A5QQM5_AMPQU|nr:DNA directed RNA polymeras-like protein III subunit Rpc82 [Ampelomyces quisqualis]